MYPILRPVACGFVVFSLGILLTSCNRDPQVQKQKFYNKALDLLKKGRVDSAKLELLNALKIDQLYAEADSTLAEIYFREKNYKQSYSLLQQALKGNPDYLPAHRGMAQFYRLMGKLPDAQQELELVLEHTPDDIETLMNLGRLEALQNNNKEAEGTFNRVLELQPGHVGALLALASVNEEFKDLASAERFLKLALEKNPRSVPVYLTLIKFYLVTRRPADAEALFPQALKQTNDVEILEAQDGYYEGAHRLDEAEAVIRKIQASHAKDPAYWSRLAEFYVRTNDLNKAKAELERVVNAHKDDASDLHRLIEVNIDLGDRKTAESLTNALLKRNKEDNYAHLLKGRLALADGNIELATVELNKALQFRADWPAAHFWIAQVEVRKGEYQRAKSDLENALQHDPEFRTARIVLAALQNHTGAVDAALLNGIRLLRTNPNDLTALMVYTESLILKKDYIRAEKALKLAEKGGAANSPDLHRQIGILAIVKNNIPLARKEFQTAWELQPASRSNLESLDSSYVVQNQLASGIDFLHQAIVSRPKDAVLQFELAKMYLWRNQRAEAIATLQAAMKLEPSNPESDILLAHVYATGNQADMAVAVLATAVKKSGATSQLLMDAGMVYERLQRWDEARKTYEDSISMDSSNAISKNNLASVLADHGGDLNVALTLAQQAKEAMVNSPEVTSTLGWIYYKRQLYPLALKYLADCAVKENRNATFQYQLGMTQWKMGRPTEARRLLKRALELDGHFPEAAAANEALSKIGPG